MEASSEAQATQRKASQPSIASLELDYREEGCIFPTPSRRDVAAHACLVHGSPPNPSDGRRIGVVTCYIPTDTARLGGEDCATLVRGEDRHRHFMAEPQPSRDLDPEFVALHRAITERCARNLYRGTDSPATTSRRRWRSAAEPARARWGAESSGLNLYQVCAILSNMKVLF